MTDQARKMPTLEDALGLVKMGPAPSLDEALDMLKNVWTAATLARSRLRAVAEAWADLDHDQRVALNDQHPDLVGALVRMSAAYTTWID